MRSGSSLRLKTAVFLLLTASVLLVLSLFMASAWKETRAVIEQQVNQQLQNMVNRFEGEMANHFDLVEENFLTIRSNEALISRFYRGEESDFKAALSSWEEDYERTRYDFIAVSFPAQDKCFLFRGFFAGLKGISCQSLFGHRQKLDNFGWQLISEGDDTLAVFSTALFLNSSGKLVGQLIGGIRLSNNRYLLNRVVDSRDQLRHVELLSGSKTLSELKLDKGIAESESWLKAESLLPVMSAGHTVFGDRLKLRVESASTSLQQLQERLLRSYFVSALVAVSLVFLLSLLLSRTLDRQLQSLMVTLYSARGKKHVSWNETLITEFNDIGQQLIQLVGDLQEQEALLRKNNADKRRILHHLIQTEEKERLRLSNDLHDDIGQLLAAMKANLFFIRDDYSRHGEECRSLMTALDLVNLMYDAIYNRIGMLRSSEEMQHFGLAGSLPLITIIPQLEQLDYAVELDIDQNRPLTREAMVNLYRITQEALTNVLKYASGTWVLVQLADEADGVRLVIQDDGVGLDADAQTDERGGFGLLSMRERTEQLDGILTIESDEGVRIEVFVPAEAAWLAAGEQNELQQYPASERTLPADDNLSHS